MSGRSPSVELPVALAQALHAAGLGWEPAPGDRFAILERDLDDEVFVVSDMVITRLDVPGGPPVLGFNGTTEWALDSLAVDEALWLPREDQLRERLGQALVRLERVPGPAGGWAVVLADGVRHVDTHPATAYARALLALLTRAAGGELSGGPGAG